MAENTQIEWADHTFNPWEGCQKVSPECDNCYAEARNIRFTGGINWGPKAPRRRTSVSNWNKPKRWNKDAAAFLIEHGRRQRVFCASLADVFDNAVDPTWRADLFELIKATPDLDWMLLTKRPQNMIKMLPDGWGDGWHNVWLGTSAGTQKTADMNIPHLLNTPAAIRFVSAEPLLGRVSFRWASWVNYKGKASANEYDGLKMLDWIIVGGESGSNARPMHPDWAREIRDQCEAAGVDFLFKQWGEWQPISEIDGDKIEALHHPAPVSRPEASQRCKYDSICLDLDGTTYSLGTAGKWACCPAGAFAGPKSMSMFRVGKKAAGRRLDGREWNDMPEVG